MLESNIQDNKSGNLTRYVVLTRYALRRPKLELLKVVDLGSFGGHGNLPIHSQTYNGTPETLLTSPSLAVATLGLDLDA